jgi:hypothetical protein
MQTRGRIMKISDDWGRLALALVVIGMISLGMYQLRAHAGTVDATFVSADVSR